MNDTPSASADPEIKAPDQAAEQAAEQSPGQDAAASSANQAAPASAAKQYEAPPEGAGERIFSLLATAGLLAPLLLAAAQVCLGLDARGLWYSDEVRHAAAYEAMRQSGNWLILTLNGNPYPDKPPLYFWFLRLLDAVPRLDPPGLFLAANALCGLLFTAATWLLARGLGYDKKTSLAATLVLLSTFSFLGVTHYARMDLLFAVCIVLSQLCLYRGWVKDSAPLWLISGFVLAALACLIKGPLGLAFPLISSLIFLIWRGSFRRAGGRDGALGFGIMLFILMAWAALVLLQDGGRDYLAGMLGRHTLGRVVDAWHHKQDWWFYLLSLPLAWLPWTLLVFFLPWERLPGLLKAAGPARLETPGHGWTWIALISGLLAISALSGKVAIYTLPLYPFLAILTAQGALALTPRRCRAFFLAVGLLLLLLAAFFGLAGAYPHVRAMLPAAIAPEKLLDMTRPALSAGLAYILTLRGLPILAGICLVFALVLFKGTNRAKPAGPLLALALFLTVLAQPLALVTAPSLDTLLSPRPQAGILRAYRDKGYHAATFHVTGGTYTFYLGGPVDEIKDWEELRKLLAEHSRIVVAASRSRWKEWQEKADFRPESFSLINAQRMGEREYVILARDAWPESAAPVPVPPWPVQPWPVMPESAKPAPATPEPAAPAAPEPATPVPATPEPAIPEPAAPEPAIPEQATPVPAMPEPAIPEPVAPESAAPEPVAPEPATPEPAPATPESTPAEPAKPAPAVPEQADPPGPQEFLDGAAPEVRRF